MKRILVSLVVLCLVLALAGCGEEAPAMNIGPASLTQAEEAIAKLLGADTGSPIFDFQVDDTVQKLSVNAYELVDGQWELFYGGGGRPFTDEKGRLALEFDTIRDGIREAVQSEHVSGSSSFESSAPLGLPEGFHRATSRLENRQEIVYDQEIPLVIQILTSRNEVRSFDPSYFHHPEEYEKYGYEHVFAITVVFSQEPLS